MFSLSRATLGLFFAVLTIVGFYGCSGELGGSSAPTTAREVTLDEKLLEAFERYDFAKQQLQGPEPADLRFTRAQLDEWLAPARHLKMDESDVAELVARQARDAEVQRLHNDAVSRIKFDIVREQGLVTRFCEGVPKGAMTHVHPNGTADAATVARLFKHENPKISAALGSSPFLEAWERDFFQAFGASGTHFNDLGSADQAEVVSFCAMKQPRVYSFSRFMWVLAEPLSLILDGEDTCDACRLSVHTDFLERAQRQGLSYVEFMVNMGRLEEPRLRALQEWRATLSERFPNLEVGWLAAQLRSQSAEDIAEKALAIYDVATSLEESPVVAFELLGDETGESALEKGYFYRELGRQMKQDGALQVGLSIHAGELGLVENTRDAVLMGIPRLGHGVRLREDPLTLEYIRQRAFGTNIDINLTSNVLLGVVDSYETHPYLHFFRLGVPVKLSTDDEGVFSTSINQECEFALNETDVSYEEWKGMSFNSIRYSFATEEKKAELYQRLHRDYAAFETRFCGDDASMCPEQDVSGALLLTDGPSPLAGIPADMAVPA